MSYKETTGAILIHTISFGVGVGIGWIIEWEIEQLPAPEIAMGLGFLPFIIIALCIAFGLSLIVGKYVLRVLTPATSYWFYSVILGIAYPLLVYAFSLWHWIPQEFAVLTLPFIFAIILHLISHYGDQLKKNKPTTSLPV